MLQVYKEFGEKRGEIRVLAIRMTDFLGILPISL